MAIDLLANTSDEPTDLFETMVESDQSHTEEPTKERAYKMVKTTRGTKKRYTEPARPAGPNPLFDGLPDDVVSAIKEKTGEIKGRGASSRVDSMRKRLANLERLRLSNAPLAELIESIPDYEAFAIGAGHAVQNMGEGIGRIFGLIDADDAKDSDFEALKSINGSAGYGDTAGNIAMFAVPGSAVAKIPSIGGRIAASAALGGAESGLQSSGSGDDIDSIAANTAVGASLGALVGGGGATGAKALSDWAKGTTPYKQEIKRLIESGSTDIEVARYIINDAGGVSKDKVFAEAVKQGFGEGAAAMVKGAGKADKARMREMVDTLVKRKENYRWGAENRPTDVAGQSILDRYSEIKKINTAAGKRLGSVAESLRGKEVDFSPAIDSFKSSLDDMGVKLGDDLTPIFTGSDIEGIPAAEGAIKRIVARMSTGGSPKAYDVHRLKKYIDENVSWGKKGEGLTGRAEGELKRLRSGLNEVLNGAFPEYKAVNKVYSDTISAIKQLDRAAGSKFDPSSPNAAKFLGTLTRRVESNAQSRIPILDEIANLQHTVEKYASKSSSKELSVIVGPVGRGRPLKTFDDDVVTQALFASELDSVFKPAARTSFEGGIGSELRRAGRMASAVKQGPWATATEGAHIVADKARGVNEENAVKAIRKLLEDSI